MPMTEPTAYLLRELAETKRELRTIRSDRDRLRKARDHWRGQARAWQWGAMHTARRGEAVEATGRAEAS